MSDENNKIDMFSESIWNILELANRQEQLKALYAFGKFYRETKKMDNLTEDNLKIVEDGIKAFQIVSAEAYAMTNRSNDDCEDDDCEDNEL